MAAAAAMAGGGIEQELETTDVRAFYFSVENTPPAVVINQRVIFIIYGVP